MRDTGKENLKKLPKIDELMEKISQRGDLPDISRQLLKEICRKEVEKVRALALRWALKPDGNVEEIVTGKIVKVLKEMTRFRLRRVINATGVILHTNLGRAPLPSRALTKVVEIGKGYSNLEFDLERGERGLRYDHVRELLRTITGAEDGLVVNNNAAAVLISLNTIARGKEVIVSRGELIEIGGEFRIPEIMERSGAILKEVGTTNRTHLRDYENAIGPETALLLKVHPSNYRIVGFTNDVPIEELVALGKKASLPVMFDLGSGCLVDMKRYCRSMDEPTIQSALSKGTDIVTASGDKLLGGPQAGIILGRKDYIGQIMRNPLNRAVRIDKLTLAALEATLMEYLNPETAVAHIPVLKEICEPLAPIRRRAGRIKRQLEKVGGKKLTVNLCLGKSVVGGGSLPGQEIDTILLTLEITGLSASHLSYRMRSLPIPIIARVEENRVFLDIRTVQAEDIADLVKGIASIVESC